jgi:hypothetical protein
MRLCIKRIRFILITAGFLAGAVSFTYCGEVKTISLDEVVAMAKQDNPQIKAAQQKYLAAESRVKSAYSLPDPWVGFEYWGFPQRALSKKCTLLPRKYPGPANYRCGPKLPPVQRI